MSDVKVKVNADGVAWVEPNTNPALPVRNVTAYRGQVVEIPAAEAERLRNVRVRVYYTDPITLAPFGVFREEPSVVDANEAEAATAEKAAAAQAKVRDLENQLAQARNDLPLVASVAVVVPVAEPPALSGARLVVDEPRDIGTDAPPARPRR